MALNHHQKERVKYINDWKVNKNIPALDYEFPVEKQFRNRVKNSESSIFKPLKFPYNDNKNFQVLVSFILDGLRFLPYRPDISFDSFWKALEVEVCRINGKQNITDSLAAASCIHWSSYFAINQNVKSALYDALASAPVQTFELGAKHTVGSVAMLNSQAPLDITIQTPQNKRLIRFPSDNQRGNLKDFLLDASVHFNGVASPENMRKCALLLRRIFSGQLNPSKTAVSSAFSISDQEKLHFFVSGIMYTFRNNRFHGSSPSPFTSSVAAMTTYAHTYYMVFVTYSLLIISMSISGSLTVTSNEIEENIRENRNIVSELFGGIMND